MDRPPPILETPRLVLRPLLPSDADRLAEFAGDREISSTTLSIPYPYERSNAIGFIESQPDKWARGESIDLAIVRRNDSEFVGVIGMILTLAHRRGELGYWIGQPYWSSGYATEAAQEMMRYGFDELGLERVYAQHFTRNPASGRIMQKLGMKYEGRLRRHILKWDVMEDLDVYGIIRGEFFR